MLPALCASRSIRLASFPLSLHSRALLRNRRYADQPQSSPTRYQPDPHASPENVQNEFAHHTITAFRDMRKVVLFLAYGSLIVGTISCTIFEAAHMWIEDQMSMAADDDARWWGWEVESWSNIETGGTSPLLGFWGRHSARAAWFSLRYGKYFTTTTTISQLGGGRADEGSLNVVDASLESARVYLEQAMERVRDEQGRVRSDSVGLVLLERHAAILERLGTQQSLRKARAEYLQVLQGRAGHRTAEARLAVKLGDLSERLGDEKVALSWWAQGIDLTNDETSALSTSTLSTVQPEPSSNSQASPASFLTRGDQLPAVSEEPVSIIHALPSRPPLSPAAQRTLVAAMLSLSAYFSKRKQLHEAQSIQEHAIRLIDAMVPLPEASSSANPVTHSPGQTLHHMYLLHRKSLLGLHHGEVTFALASSTIKTGPSPHTAALMDLLTAASSSEVVAQILTGLPLSHPDLPSSYQANSAATAQPPQHIPHPPSSDSPLLPAYRDSPTLAAPAGSVLRDARLAAAEAWDLCGVLYSDLSSADCDVKALECFERALGWVGDPTESRSREGMGVTQWEALWARFVDAREKVLKKPR